MAAPVYDSEDELRQREQEFSTPADEAEDKKIEKGANPDDQPRGGMGRQLRVQSQKADDDKAEAREGGLRDTWDTAKDVDEDSGQSFYKSFKGKPTGIRGLVKRRKMIGLGVAGTIIAILFGLSGWLGVFKLDFVMNNIDTKSFARTNGSLDFRNKSYIRTYMELRLADVCPSISSCDNINLSNPADSDNLIFRSNKISRGNPIFNWYQSMRSSSFEKDVFNKNGVFLTSGSYRDGNKILFRTIKVTIGGQDIAGSGIPMPDDLQAALKTAFEKGTWGDINSGKLNLEFGNFTSNLDKYINVEFFDTNSARRGVINQLVDANTQPWQVFKQRQMRKDLASKLGSPKWRFFDDTRQKIDAKKIDIRNKIIDAATPDGTKTGRFINCLFGISDCKFSADTSNPAENATASDALGTTIDPKTGKEVPISYDYTVAKEGLSKLVGGISTSLNVGQWISTLDSLAKISNTLKSGGLTASVAVARGVQAMALYQTLETARDQIKTGQANADEVNQFMQNIANITAAEAWIKTVDGQGNPAVPAVVAGSAAAVSYCSANHVATENEFAYLCNNSIIGGASGAQALSDAYNNGPGKILSPVLGSYDQLFGGVAGLFNSLFNTILTPFINAGLATLKVVLPSAYNGVYGGLAWAVNQLGSLLGAGPIVGKTTPSGQIGSWVVQGGAYTAESSNRSIGAASTTPTSKSTTHGILGLYQQEQTSQQSLVARYLSPNNPQSPVANGLFAVSQIKLSSVGSIFTNFGAVFKAIASAFSLPFSHRALAASANNGYVAAEVAQIQTYDFPAQCYNTDPLSMTPQNGTNIQAVLGSKVKPNDLTWGLVTNSTSWYAYLYSLKPSAKQAEQVYNCNLLDNAVRGDLGYVYGYTADNGFPGTGPSNSTSSNSTTDPSNLYADSSTVDCASGTTNLGVQTGYTNGSPINIRLCAVANLPSSGDESRSGSAYYISGANGKAVVNSRVSADVVALAAAAKSDGVNLSTISTFRTMAHQQALCSANSACASGDYSSVAQPGTSNHQMGLAIDFAGLPATPGPVSYNPIWTWLSQNAISFGYKNYPKEAWHWSPTGN